MLHQPCRPVERFDDDLARLVETMFASMYAARGVGLAANQSGVGRRVFVYDCPDENDAVQKGVMINPVLRLPTGRSAGSTTARKAACRFPAAPPRSLAPAVPSARAST
ncbi:peptide deformylase [Nonomuraea rubra]|uniref:peptide deformylase n=1 Tax=Nonomuraea rubra TaxID=46180 RepID=UPI00361263A9